MGTESRGRYLIFALRIRKLTDALIALVEEGKETPNLEEPIERGIGFHRGLGSACVSTVVAATWLIRPL